MTVGQQTHTDRRFVALDGLRATAAAVVALAHACSLCFPEPSGLNHALGWLAREAVVIFFVISGFAIFTSIRAIVGAQESFLFEYALRRGCRIVPPLIFSIAISCACAAMISAVGPVHWTVHAEQFIRGITLTYKTGDAVNIVNGPLWSLRLEVCLYVISGALVLAARNRNRTGKIAAFLIAAMVLLAMVGKLWFAIPALFLFGLGAAAAWLDRFIAPRIAAVIAAIILVLLLVGGCFLDTTASFEALETRLGHALQLLSGVCLMLLFSEMRSKDGCVLDGFSRFAWAGSFAYTLYIVHMPILLLLSDLVLKPFVNSGAAGQATAVLISLLAAFPFAVISAKIFEQPGWYRKKMRLLLAKSWSGAGKPAAP